MDTAATTYEGRKLKLLFLRAYRGERDAGYHEGYREGEEEGYHSGYSEGYVEGRNFDEEAAKQEFLQLIGKKSPMPSKTTIPAVSTSPATQNNSASSGIAAPVICCPQFVNNDTPVPNEPQAVVLDDDDPQAVPRSLTDPKTNRV